MRTFISIISTILIVGVVSFCLMAFLPTNFVTSVNNWGNGKIEQITYNATTTEDGTQTNENEINVDAIAPIINEMIGGGNNE